jgi:uncharacterized RDD family membrane protein YckC
MSNTGGWQRSAADFAHVPQLPAAAFAGVRTRRMVAIAIDLMFITLLFLVALAILLVLGVVTFGLAWFLIPPLYPAIAFLYNGMTVSGWRMGTPGMRMMDLEVRMTDGSPVPFLNAAAHALLFYLSWVFLTPLVLLVSLFSNGKRCLHDMLAGIVVTRRP